MDAIPFELEESRWTARYSYCWNDRVLADRGISTWKRFIRSSFRLLRASLAVRGCRGGLGASGDEPVDQIITGAVGGVAGGTLLGSLLGGAAGADPAAGGALGGILGDAIGGAGGGAILTAIVGAIMKGMNK